ncbi:MULTISPECIES: acyl-CoA dehydrogenase family protein [Metallosphaera]|uniref:acyl-CoA dehydrogenase family protein n=1 Tax=Metallosphaera TaxID=41980 RepID=UPI001F0674F6|nr:acyl-CoA dehydrogenase family protein [Metallosphaera sedula]MCH1771031.1 acyl-CoA dehydrogenase family protein [Metallosphaera sedula]MCP6729388.1 acyl-CoA dehydrogenase family protein [Metallosphaera sedula]
MDELLISTVSDFARREILRVADKIDRDDFYPRDLISKMGELGILDPLHHGAELLDSMLCLEEIAKVSGSVALIQDVQGELVNAPLRRYGRDNDLTEKIAEGKILGSFALSEPCCGSDTSAMRSTARKVNGTWRIDGEKMWITQGLYANVFLVAAKNDEGKISAFLVRDTQCIEREKIEVQGNRGTGTARIRMNECEGELIGGWEVIKYALAIGRIAISAISLGLALGAMEEAYNWAKERQAFGKRLMEHEGIAWLFSDSIAELESVKALLDATCNAFTRDWKRAEPLISSLKLVSSGVANRVVDRMVQVMGGMGYAKLTRVERAYRDVRLTRIGEGTDEVQRMILSRHIDDLVHEL